MEDDSYSKLPFLNEIKQPNKFPVVYIKDSPIDNSKTDRNGTNENSPSTINNAIRPPIGKGP
jgi:hypothetical protein